MAASRVFAIPFSNRTKTNPHLKMARDLTLLTQENKYTVGQCVIAMVTFCSLQTALDALDLEGGTNFRNMIAALNRLEVDCDQVPRPAGRPPIPVKRAIVEIKSKLKPELAFFAVFSAGAWYCPAKGFSEGAYHKDWPRHFYCSRFIEIRNVK